jgi:hypothetical protein
MGGVEVKANSKGNGTANGKSKPEGRQWVDVTKGVTGAGGVPGLKPGKQAKGVKL